MICFYPLHFRRKVIEEEFDEGYDPAPLDTVALFSGFVVLQILFNWVQFLRHRSHVAVSTKNFPGYVHRWPSLTTSKDQRTCNEDFEAVRAAWKECEACDMHVPLLSHHCSHCRKCIYALDHHCYFLGHCVGRANFR